MARTSASKFSIRVHPTLADWPEWDELRAKGHDVRVLTDADAGLILGPTCWRMSEELRPYLKEAVKAAGKVARENKG